MATANITAGGSPPPSGQAAADAIIINSGANGEATTVVRTETLVN